MNLKIEQPESNGKLCEMKLIGRLDSETAPALDQQFEVVIKTNPDGLILDLEELSYLSSAGIRSLFIVQNQLTEGNAKLWVLAPQEAVLKVLSTVRILQPGGHIAGVPGWRSQQARAGLSNAPASRTAKREGPCKIPVDTPASADHGDLFHYPGCHFPGQLHSALPRGHGQ